MSEREQLVREAEELARALDYISPICDGLHDSEWRHKKAAGLRRLLSLLPKEGEVVDIEVVSDRLCLAWSRYKRNFGEPPHGTAVQFKALIQLAGGVEKLLSTKP